MPVRLFEDHTEVLIDCEKDENTPAKYGIRSIPYVIVENDGELVGRGSAGVMIPNLKNLV